MYTGMYNNGNANSLQCIFEWNPIKTAKNITQLYIELNPVFYIPFPLETFRNNSEFLFIKYFILMN